MIRPGAGPLLEPPSPPVAAAGGGGVGVCSSPVAAAAFRRLECNHEELFQPEYKRSNRTKGLKILRCFPHCCPNHMERSYCGSALHVIVRTTKPLAPHEAETEAPPPPLSADEYPSEALAVGDLAVFARFESASDPGLDIGECLSIDTMSANTQSEENPEGQWIPSFRERASVLIQNADEAPPENTLVYQLNGKIYSRWYYDWESGANKAQRLMKHVLKAYVFEKCVMDAKGNILSSLSSHGTPPPPQALLYRIVAVIISPEFTVISYRRAPSEGLGVKGDSQPLHISPPYYSGAQQQQQQQQRVVSPASSGHPTTDRLKRPLGAVDAHIKEDRWGEDEPTPTPSYPSYEPSHYYPESANPRSMKRRRPTDSFVRPVASSLRLPQAPSPLPPPPPLPMSFASSSSSMPIHSIEEKVLWEHAHSSAVTTSKNLALVYWFAQMTPLATYAPFVDELVHITHRRLLEPLAPRNLPVARVNCFSRVLLEQADYAAGPSGAAPALPYELEALLRVVAQALLWLHSNSTRQWLRAFFQLHAGNALNKHALRASFLALLAEMEEQLNHHVFAMTPLKSLANVAEEIIAAVYSCERFLSKRPRVRQILGSQGFAGWSAFVAQLREAYISSQSSGRRSGAPPPLPGAAVASDFLRTATARNAFEHRWNNEWLLDMEEAVWKQSEPGSASGVSLFTLFDLISQVGRLEVALGVQERTLRIRSTTSLSTGTDSMLLVLDGRERVFRLLPNGVSTSLSPGSAGDYIGSIHMEGKDRLVVYLEVFRWTTAAASERSYHVRMRIECWRNNRLYVNGEVLVSALTPSLTEAEQPFLGEMKLRAKRRSVEQMVARQFQAAAPGASTALPPVWKALGRFRLSYHCLGK